MQDKLETTFDWSKCFKPETPWRFGVYDISMNLPLDYSLHLRENTFRSSIWTFSEEDLIKFELEGCSREEEPSKMLKILQHVMAGVGCGHNAMYAKYVIEKLNSPKNCLGVPSLVKFELGPIVYVIFNEHASWPMICRKSDVDDSNYLTYSQKGPDVFVLDNHGMVRADY